MIDSESSAGSPLRFDRDWIDHLCQSQWIVPASRYPLRAKVTGPDEIVVGNFRTSILDAVAARPRGPVDETLRFCLTHDSWKVVPLKAYRPLAYYAAFGSAEVFDCLQIAIRSLVTFGKWEHDIAVLTRVEDVDAVADTLSPLQLGARLFIETVPGDDILDWCLARYRIDNARVFRTHQPLLYLDTDVFCDGPLDALCMSLASSSRIEAKAEGLLSEGSPDAQGHWYGSRLMTADGQTVGRRERGFSTGVLGFANAHLAADAFSAILRSAYGHAAFTGDRSFFAGYDQPIANYVLRTLGLVSFTLMESVASFCRVQPGETPLPGPGHPRGLVHFNGVVGDSSSKRRAMQRYLASLAPERSAESSNRL